MADGTDVWLAQAVLSHRRENPALKLHCILPCEGQELKWAAPARERYHSILDQADSILYVSRVYYDGCMLARNRRLVDLADILLAVYNGERRGVQRSLCATRKRLAGESSSCIPFPAISPFREPYPI